MSEFSKLLKQYILPWLLIVVLIGGAIDYIFTQKIAFGSKALGSYKMHRLCSTESNLDIPIIGSSRAEVQYISDSIHPQCFNYGISGTGWNVAYYFMQSELAKKKESPIILNYDLTTSVSFGDQGNYIPMAYNSNIRNLLGDQLKIYYFIPFFRYFGFFEYATKEYFNAKNTITCVYDNKGGKFEERVLNDAHFQSLLEKKRNKPDGFVPSEYNNNMLTLLKTTNRKIYVIVSPMHPVYKSTFKAYSESMQYVTSLDALPNVQVIDLSYIITADSLFHDPNHLNFMGAKIFSAKLQDTLSKIEPLFTNKTK